MNSKQAANDLFLKRFNSQPTVLACAPGRVELAGNHTDHQGGLTLSAAIDRYMWAFAAPNNTDEVVVVMDGFGEARLSCAETLPRENERGTSAAIIRGMMAARASSARPLRGFNAAIASDIPAGGGLSSSAALEVLLGATMRALFDEPTKDTAPAFMQSALCELAFEGAHAEQAYFGKPCGAQDQLACSLGGVVALDFSCTPPHVSSVELSADLGGYSLCLIDSACDHSKYAEQFAAIPADMCDVAHFFGQERLCEVSPDVLLENLASVRAKLGDKKVLRALHYFEETARVARQHRALKAGDFSTFLTLARASGASSAQFLQNVSGTLDGSQAHQPAMFILALCAHLLGETGAYRIHGGGFGGSVLAFVPANTLPEFTEQMNAFCGYPACMPVRISPQGTYAKRLR